MTARTSAACAAPARGTCRSPAADCWSLGVSRITGRMPLRMNSPRAWQEVALLEADLALLHAQADRALAADEKQRRRLRLAPRPCWR